MYEQLQGDPPPHETILNPNALRSLKEDKDKGTISEATYEYLLANINHRI